MEKCRTEHSFCSKDEDFPLPSRVIDVGSDSREPFLCNTKGQMGKWVTLSHCWGNHTPSRTTLGTLRQNKTSLPLNELQINFQDAICITRKLGFQYLWIDALCIIQDSPEDWAREASQVYEIYFGASLNISAATGSSRLECIFSSDNKNRCHMKPLFHLESYSATLAV